MTELPARPSDLSPIVQTLIDTIRLEMEQGRERASFALENEKKTSYWNIGKHIKDHLLQHADRAEYGTDLFSLLSANLEINYRTLYQCVQFYESYPQILSSSSKLTWTHYRTLLAIPDKSEREAFESKIVEENLSVSELKELIREERGVAPMLPTLSVTRDTPYVYKWKKILGQDMVDLGFNIFIDNASISDKSIAQVDEMPHYTYKAVVVEVVDGDTVWINIDLGYHSWTTQKVRLRGINAPELDTPKGKAAKEYAEKQLKDCKFIAVKTYWRDKFTRYLADIFYSPTETDLNALIQTGTFLNQEMLDKGLAERY